MHVLVTRPEPQATAWVHELQASGITASALPLIGISAPESAAPIQEVWSHLSRYRAVMFVSPAAVDWFFRLQPPHCTWPAGTLATAPGPGTASDIRKAGIESGFPDIRVISPGSESPQFDSESLWPLLAPFDWRDQRVCIVSGGDGKEAKGRTWLTQQWQTRGAQVDTIVTYRRTPASWSPSQQALFLQAVANPSAFAWLFSSSEALNYLANHFQHTYAPDHPIDWNQTKALVTHPRIAERAQQLGMAQITQSKPALAEVVLALRNLP